MLASPPSVNAPSRGLLIASYLAVCILWGSTYLGIAVALEGFPPFLLGAVRFIASGSLMIAFARFRGEPWPDRRQWAGVAVAGVFLFVIGNGLINVAEHSVASGVAAVLVATMPLWMTVFGRVIGEPVSRLEIAGVVIGLVGVGVMNLGGELRASPLGVILLVLAPMGWAIGSLASKRLPSPPGMMRAGGQMLVGGFAMGLVALALGERMDAAPSARAIGAVLYLLVAGSLIGFSAYSYLLKHTRPVIATSYAYVNPVIAVILGVTIAGESFDLASGIGGVIILAAILLVGLSRSSSSSKPAPAPVVATPVAPSSSQPSTAASTSQPSMSARVSVELPAVAACQPLASSARP
jgi:drug/metabolite transporter (DMT)-like permease